MKKLICVFLAFLVFFVPNNSLATAKEDIIYIQKDIIESNMVLVNDNRSFGWEYINSNTKDALYSLYVFENGKKYDYAVDFILTDNGSRVGGLDFYMFFNGTTESLDRFVQIYDFISVMVCQIKKPSSEIQWTNLTRRFYDCVLNYLVGDTDSKYYIKGANNAILGIEFNVDHSAIRLRVWFGDAPVK